jgi:hypothetical protein
MIPRSLRFVPFVLLLATATVFAAEPGNVHVSGLYVRQSDLGVVSDFPSADKRAYGVSLDYRWMTHLSTMIAVSSEPALVTKFVADPAFGTLPATELDRLHPIDGVLRYHFGMGSRLQPYVGAGARYIRSGSLDNYRPEANAGFTLALTRHVTFDADWKRLYRERQPALFTAVRDGEFTEGGTRRLSLGLGWTF